MRTKFKAWAEPFINEHTEVMLKGEDLASKKDFVLEIGSGKGQFLLLMSQKFPTLDFVGIILSVCNDPSDFPRLIFIFPRYALYIP